MACCQPSQWTGTLGVSGQQLPGDTPSPWGGRSSRGDQPGYGGDSPPKAPHHGVRP